jgi:hypothetical protein
MAHELCFAAYHPGRLRPPPIAALLDTLPTGTSPLSFTQRRSSLTAAGRICWIAAWSGSAQHAPSQIALRAPLPLRRTMAIRCGVGCGGDSGLETTRGISELMATVCRQH